MNIALMEYVPMLENFLIASLKEKPYFSKLHLCNASKTDRAADLALSDESRFPGSYFCPAGLYLLHSGVKINKTADVLSVLCCGMGSQDGVTLSSIRENEAMLCLQKELVFLGEEILPFEQKIPFDRSYSIYKNIAVGFTAALLDQIFGENETNNAECRMQNCGRNFFEI